MSQPPVKEATGLPQFDGLGVPVEMSEGMAERGKNQMEMWDDVHSVAYTPP